VSLVAALTLSDHDAKAREALQRYFALPSTGLKTIAAWKAYCRAQNGDPRFVEMTDRICAGLRKPGMPEERARRLRESGERSSMRRGGTRRTAVMGR
jgi:hypothetical protein